jgi:hypothetical protein
MAPKVDPRLKRNQPAPVPSNFLGARKKEVAPKAEALGADLKAGKRQLSQSAEKMASVSKKTKDAVYDPKSEAVPLSAAFRSVRGSSPAASSVTTQEVQELESDTDVEAAAESAAVGEATSQMENLGQAKVG